MILGVYWYFDFPDGLYTFDYFVFNKGYGGHADNPAALVATVARPQPEALLAGLRDLAATYPEAALVVYWGGDKLKIVIGSYQLHDYEFHFATQVEALLRREQAAPISDQPLPNAQLLRFNHPLAETYPQGQLLQVVGSGQRLHHAETLALRLDCHLALAQKRPFLTALGHLCDQAGLDVLYYFDHDFGSETNLMVFFTNGRQGLGGHTPRSTNAPLLEQALQKLLTQHHAQPRHTGAWAQYPRHGPHIERIVDADCVR